MRAKIIGFKGNRRDTFNNSCIVEVTGDKNPPALMGMKVFWKTATGRSIQGKIVHTHGKSALLAKFRKGLPGFALGDELMFKAPPLPKPKKVAKKAVKKAEAPEVAPEKPKASAKKVAAKKKAAHVKKAPAKASAKKVAEKKAAPEKKKAPAKASAKKVAEKKAAPEKKKASVKASAKKPPVKEKPEKKAAE